MENSFGKIKLGIANIAVITFTAAIGLSALDWGAEWAANRSPNTFLGKAGAAILYVRHQ
jgi:hypothetical protein